MARCSTIPGNFPFPRLGLLFTLCIFLSFRTETHVDPPVEPAKLFRVERIKPYKGCPYWEKRILRDLGLGEDVSVLVLYLLSSELIFLSCLLPSRPVQRRTSQS